MKTDLFQSWGPCWVFQICWHIECKTFTASSFRIWSSSTGISSPPLALLIVMLPKATWLWILGGRSYCCDYLGHEDLFCIVLLFLPPLLNIFCFCQLTPFLSFIEPIFAWNVPLVSLIFFKRSLVFSILLFSSIFCIDHWGRLYLSLLFFGTLHSNRYIFPYLLCFSPLFFSQPFVGPPQTAILPFCISFWGDCLDPCLLYNVKNLHS